MKKFRRAAAIAWGVLICLPIFVFAPPVLMLMALVHPFAPLLADKIAARFVRLVSGPLIDFGIAGRRLIEGGHWSLHPGRQ